MKAKLFFIITYIEELMFYDQCVGSNVILGDFEVGLDTAIVKVINL